MTTVRYTRRWRGVTAVALFAGAVGVFAKRPTVLLAAVVGIAFAVYPRLGDAPTVDLDVERTVSDDSPDHGDDVEVTVRVRNVGDRTLPDLRVVDGVPSMLPVTSGTARRAALLRPGGTCSFSYTVRAKRGTHRFRPATVVARNLAGSLEVETTVATETELACGVGEADVPLRTQTRQRSGRLVTDDGGSGIEFHRTREYRHGDPMSRIDWRRFARTGELSTVEFREERTASVVLCLDARAAAYRGLADEPHAVSYGVAAAEEMLTALQDAREYVGVAAVGREFCWLTPGRGPEHAARVRDLLATHPTLSTVPPDASNGTSTMPPGTSNGTADAARQVTELEKRLAADAQVVVVSPLADQFVAKTALGLEASGHATTVVSPDVTATDTVGGRLAVAERENRIHSLRESGVAVVDWDPDEPLGAAAIEARERWST